MELFDRQAADYLTRRFDRSRRRWRSPRSTSGLERRSPTRVVGGDESYRIDSRVRRLNSSAFDVAETASPRGLGRSADALRATHVVEQGHHQRRLLR